MSAHEGMNEYARWQARFATPDYAFGKEPNYFLKSCQKILPPRGRALAVADGEGRNGVWLAEQALDIVSLDFSPAAQSKARDKMAWHAADAQIRRSSDYPGLYAEAIAVWHWWSQAARKPLYAGDA